MARRRSKSEERALLWRAIAAWVKYADPRELNVSLDEVRAVIVEIGGRSYVSLTAGARVLASYRIRVDGSLKKLRRPPRELRGEGDE